MRILITGAAGQLGRALQEELADRELVALPHSALDITRLDSVRSALRAHHPAIVINAAAFTHVDDAQGNPDAAYRANALGPRNLALATGERGIPMVHVSTDYVFEPRPQSVYGASKLAGEAAVREMNPRHFVIRTAWLYHKQGSNFLNTMRSLAGGGPLRIVSDQYGSPTYAPHLASAIAKVLQNAPWGTYHMAGLGAASWFDLASALFQRLGSPTPLAPVSSAEFPRPAPRPRYSVLTTLQDPEILLPSWQDGVEEYVRSL
jgi:dTDP-4-dehydrorhamnose reductase